MANTQITYFQDCDKAARTGTQRIVQWLRDSDFWVTNLEKIPEFQKKDIDLYAHRRDVGPLWLELKVDGHSSNNLFLEVVGNDNTGIPGCIYKTKSNHLMYFYDATGELIVMPTRPLQEWLRKNEGRFRRVSVPTTSSNGKHWYNTVGLLVPKKVVLKEIVDSNRLFLPAVS